MLLYYMVSCIVDVVLLLQSVLLQFRTVIINIAFTDAAIAAAITVNVDVISHTSVEC